MTIQFNCKCGKLLNVPAIHSGKSFKCKACNTIVIIPNASNIHSATTLPPNKTTTNSSVPTKIKTIMSPIAESKIRIDSIQPDYSDDKTPIDQAALFNCSYCEEEFHLNAIKCKHCGKVFKTETDLSEKTLIQTKIVSTEFIVWISILTFGLYYIFFLERIFKELNRRGYRNISPWKAIGLSLIPFFNLIWLIILWREIARFFVNEYDIRNLKKPSVTLFLYWPLCALINLVTPIILLFNHIINWHFINDFTLILTSIFILIIEIFALTKAQNLLNEIPFISTSDEPAFKASNPKATLSLTFACIGTMFAPLEILAIILGHMALNEIKKNYGQKGKGFAKAGLVIGYSYIIFIISIIIFIGVFQNKNDDLTANRIQRKDQLSSISNLTKNYEYKFNRPIQSFDELQKLYTVLPKLKPATLSSESYIFFNNEFVSEQNKNKWRGYGKIWIYEKKPDSSGQRFYLSRTNHVIEVSEAQFQKLLKEEITNFNSP